MPLEVDQKLFVSVVLKDEYYLSHCIKVELKLRMLSNYPRTFKMYIAELLT